MSPKVTTSSVDKRDKKRKFRTDGTAIWTRPIVDGPGVWVSCVKGKERQTVGELYDLFESLADELWPQSSATAAATSSAVPGDDGSDNSDDDDDGLSLEQQIARQVAAIKRPRREQRFANCNTNTPCLVFISTKPPVDPVQLVTRHINNVRQTGVTGTRNTHRLTPVSASCTANLPEIRSLATRVLRAFFDSQPERSYSYKIELHVRNHSTLARDVILREIASCVPPGHTVQLGNPEIFILVEVFKAVCGIGIVRDYYDLQKFNVMELAAAVAKERAAETVEAGPSDNSTVTAQPLEPVPTT